MGRRAQQAYEQLFDEDERAERCITPRSESMRRQLRRMAGQGRLLSLGLSLYARPEHWSQLRPDARALHVLRGLSKLHPDWVFCGPSAALVYGLWVSYAELKKVHVCVKSGRHMSCDKGLCLHRSTGDIPSTLVAGVRVTSLEQAIVDCLCRVRFEQAVALADSYLRATGATRVQLIELLLKRGTPRKKGLKNALYAARIADARSESGGESIARATMYALGYAIPDLQVEIPDPIDGGVAYRADYLWELSGGRKIAGELDGREKYVNLAMTKGRASVDVFADERLRESRIAAQGVTVMRFSYSDVSNKGRFSKILACYGVPRRARASREQLVRIQRGLRMVRLPGRLRLGEWIVDVTLCASVLGGAVPA